MEKDEGCSKGPKEKGGKMKEKVMVKEKEEKRETKLYDSALCSFLHATVVKATLP